jgi:uncharacterized protein (TIGR02145 family)
MKLNFKIRSVLGCYVLCAPVFALAQGSMNVHRPGAQVLPTIIDLAEIDSVVHQLEPPPGQLHVHRTDGSMQAFLFSMIDSVTYSPAGPEGTALVATLAPFSVHSYAANLRGSVGDNGNSPITARGICYGTGPLPELDGAFVVPTAISSLYSAWAIGLQPGTTYYARAFVTNAQGTAYGNQISFTTPTGSHLNGDITYGPLTDQDGNTYATVTIGSQVWMAENLRATTYANGDPIPNVTESALWGWDGPEEGAWCLFNNDPVFDQVMGKLYNWYAVYDPRNICPSGWHVPTELDWQAMELEMGMPVEDLDLAQNRGVAEQVGLKLRTIGSQYWVDAMPATNESGFSGIAAGGRSIDGGFGNLALTARWWTATSAGGNNARTRGIFYSSAGFDATHVVYPAGHSVRCVMD